MQRALDWDHPERLRADWSGKFVVKGLLHRDDVIRAVAVGADGVILSNHGGRQLDCAIHPLEQLSVIKESIGDACEIFIDSGFRRSSDMVKALGLGAKGAFVGRAALYGLAASGQEGAERALTILSDELAACIGQLGCAGLSDLQSTMMVLDGSFQPALLQNSAIEGRTLRQAQTFGKTHSIS